MKAKVSVRFIFLYWSGQFLWVELITEHIFMQKDKPQISEIVCYVGYSLQNVINEIDFNKLCTSTSQSCKRWEKHQILQHFLKFWAV